MNEYDLAKAQALSLFRLSLLNDYQGFMAQLQNLGEPALVIAALVGMLVVGTPDHSHARLASDIGDALAADM